MQLLAADNQPGTKSPTASRGTDDSSDEDPPAKKSTPSTISASKNTPLPERGNKQRSGNPLCRTGSNSSESASSVNDSPHSNLDPSPHRAVGGGRKSYPPPSKVPLNTPEAFNDNEKGMLRARAIEATNDIAPSTNGRTPELL